MKLDKVIAVRTDKTVYKDGDKVIKIFNNNYSKANILNEALNQARVEETGLNVPSLLEVTKIDGKWAIVTQFIPGKTLEMLMKENPDKRDEYVNLFVDVQKEILCKRAPMLNKLTEKMQMKISAANLDAAIKYELHTRLDAAIRYELHTRLDAMPRHKKVCHGDFNPSNIIITDEGVPYVLDWSHVTQGNGAADAARSYLLFWLAKEINTAEKYLDLFCEKTETKKQYVQKWIPIVAASQLTKGNENQRTFLMHWIDVVDYE